MGYRWTFVILAWMALIPTVNATEPIQEVPNTVEDLEAVTVCSDLPTGDCKRITCMDICLKDTTTDPLECPMYCNLHATKRSPAGLGVAELKK